MLKYMHLYKHTYAHTHTCRHVRAHKKMFEEQRYNSILLVRSSGSESSEVSATSRPGTPEAPGAKPKPRSGLRCLGGLNSAGL